MRHAPCAMRSALFLCAFAALREAKKPYPLMPTTPVNLSIRKRILFAIVSLILSCALSLAIAETILRLRRSHIRQSDRMDPGMIVYDPILGWKMVPGWSGRHRHHDFDATYTINRYGFRGDFPSNGLPAKGLNTLSSGTVLPFALA